ncbi:2-polyprenyl-6-methoxyphenol hydroxylase [Streptomyces sp. 2323.1]|uniref:monooxygenase n=1 Tax=Streptomyces sp. 2323.1 TaxID=1938841 RepID=UPI000BB8482C|nr:monooxygenase [Streptomyces sp. 2323.1]SOE15894.1 2-polyprenyl-6-methoxyphenol hydroxylase [Streptomyces sp. 2323.1]
MSTEVIVVGAGPTGLMLGCELALAGVRTLIVERRHAPQPNSRALTLHPRSIELMDLRGLAPRFLGHGRTAHGWHFAGLDTQLDFTALDTRHGYTLFIPQARTETLLEERARELGVEILRGHEVVGVHQDAEGVEVDVRGPEGEQTVRARYVVGCDGGRSSAREAAGVGFPGTDETMTGILGDFAIVDRNDPALQRARARGVLIVPLDGNITLFVCIDPARMRVSAHEPVTLDEFRSSLRSLCGSDCGIDEPRWLSRFGNATRLAERYRAGRILLAGDAAHIHFPAGGQGLNTGLQDAMNLGWKLAAEVHGWAPPGLLDSYDTERRPVGQAVTENTEVQTLLAELTLVDQYARPAAALRELIDELLGMEVVNRCLAGRVSALDTGYPPAGANADALIGRRMPDIGLTAAASNATRANELLLHGRFALLDFAGDEALRPAVETGWAERVNTVTVTQHDDHPELEGVTEVLVRPDGHVAWASRSSDTDARRTERTAALADWAGLSKDALPTPRSGA